MREQGDFVIRDQTGVDVGLIREDVDTSGEELRGQSAQVERLTSPIMGGRFIQSSLIPPAIVPVTA